MIVRYIYIYINIFILDECEPNEDFGDHHDAIKIIAIVM